MTFPHLSCARSAVRSCLTLSSVPMIIAMSNLISSRKKHYEPLTGVALPNKIFVSNHALRNLIREWPALCDVLEVDEKILNVPSVYN